MRPGSRFIVLAARLRGTRLEPKPFASTRRPASGRRNRLSIVRGHTAQEGQTGQGRPEFRREAQRFPSEKRTLHSEGLSFPPARHELRPRCLSFLTGSRKLRLGRLNLPRTTPRFRTARQMPRRTTLRGPLSTSHLPPQHPAKLRMLLLRPKLLHSTRKTRTLPAGRRSTIQAGFARAEG